MATRLIYIVHLSVSDVQYWDDRMMSGPCQPLELAIETALEWLEDHSDATEIYLDEMRAPTVDDVDRHDYTADVIDALNDWLREDAQFVCDDGEARLYTQPDSPEYAAVRDAIRAYIRAHVDLTEAAWQPTGRQLVVRRDGSHEITGGE